MHPLAHFGGLEIRGVDEDDPLNSIDDGIRLEPFNMRREMREGHFDESGFYVLNKEGEMQLGRRTPTPICAEGFYLQATFARLWGGKANGVCQNKASRRPSPIPVDLAELFAIVCPSMLHLVNVTLRPEATFHVDSF